MAWREQLREASFRGVAFSVRESDRDGLGRRVEVHEYPFRERPFVEDLGGRSRRFQLDAFVLGADYMAARDALIAALEEKGAGTLVHPTLGTLTVVCEDGSVRESTEAGGMAVFRLSFVESEGATAPAATVDTGVAVDAQAQAAAAVTDDAFAAGFSVAGWPAFVAQSAESLVGRAMDAIEDVTAPLTGAGEALFDLSRRLGALRGDVAGLVRAPLNLALAVRAVIGSVRALAASPRAAFLALASLLDFGGGDPPRPSVTPARMAQRTNDQLIKSLVRRHAATEAARAVADLTFDSYQDAVAIGDQLVTALDDLAVAAADLGEDDAYRALEDLRLAVVRDVAARGGSLARLVRHTPRTTTPALVIAHDLYGDALRAEDVVQRNGLRHPGFVAGGRSLEVLSDV